MILMDDTGVRNQELLELRLSSIYFRREYTLHCHC